MWKAPYRPNNQITQDFNSGLVKIYSVENVAPPGYKPVEKLVYKLTLRYDEQRLGIQRYYSGQQNQTQIERVIRAPRVGRVSNQDVAITEDGHKYRIDLVQVVMEVYPSSMDLTLARLDQDYELDDEIEEVSSDDLV